MERKKKAAQFLAQLAEKKATVSSEQPVEDEERTAEQEEGEIATNSDKNVSVT